MNVDYTDWRQILAVSGFYSIAEMWVEMSFTNLDEPLKSLLLKFTQFFLPLYQSSDCYLYRVTL